MTLIRAELIRVGDNDRKSFSDVELRKLAASIEEHGLAQEPVVRPVEGGYEIVCGERRFRAMTTILGYAEVPVVVREMDDRQAAAVMLAENMARADLSPTEEGRAYESRMARFGWTNKEMADVAGVSWNRVDAKVQLLKLVPEAQHLVDHGGLKETWAWGMFPLDADRQRLALAALSGTTSHAQFRALCARLLDEQNAEPMFDPDAFFQVEEYVATAIAGAKETRPEAMRRIIEELLFWAPDAPTDLVEAAHAVIERSVKK